jgi:hypothetical protein
VQFIIRLLAERLVTPQTSLQPRRYRVAHFGLTTPLLTGLYVPAAHHDIRIVVSAGNPLLIGNRENGLSLPDMGARHGRSGLQRANDAPRKNATVPAVKKGDKGGRK